MAGGGMGSSGGGGSAQDLNQLSTILQRFGGGAGANTGGSGNPMGQLTNMGMQMMRSPQGGMPPPMPMQGMVHPAMQAQPLQGALPPQMMGVGQGMPPQAQSLLPWQAMMR